MNDALRARLGLGEGEAVADVRDVLSVASRVIFETHVVPRLALGAAVEGALLVLKGRDGGSHAMVASIAPRSTPDGAVHDCVLIAVHERDRYEQELDEARARAEQASRDKSALIAELEHARRQLAIVLEEAPAWILVTQGPAHEIELAGAALRAALGGRPLVGLPLERAWPELAQAGLIEHFVRALEGEPHAARDLHLPAGVHEERVIHLTLTPLADAAGRTGRVLLHALDVSEQRVLEARLRARQRMEVAGTLAGGVAHELNGMLGAIRIASDTLEAEAGARAELDTLRSAVARGSALTGQLLSFTRQALEQPADLELDARLSHMEPLLRSLLREDVAWRSALGAGSACVHIDGTQLDLVLTSLVLNAVTAIDGPGSITLHTDVLPAGAPELAGVARSRGAVRLRLQDTGCGMLPEVQARMYEAFFTTSPTAAWLGLTTVWGIVERAGGRIECRSELGAGTTFTIVLPVVEPARAAGTVRSSSKPRSARILVVDDDATLRRALTRMLRLWGHEATPVASAEASLETLASTEGAFDALITDFAMPKMTGTALLDVVGARWPTLPGLLISGFTADEDVRSAVAASRRSFLGKPFSAEQLEAALAALLAD